jgi:hypothetical protein
VLSLEYIAGFIDGEGCIGIYKNDNQIYPRLAITNTNREILAMLQLQFGGYLHAAKINKDKNYKPSYVWCLSSSKCINLIKKIEPLLIIKRSQALLLMAYDELRPGYGVTWDREVADKLISTSRELNRKGILNN